MNIPYIPDNHVYMCRDVHHVQICRDVLEKQNNSVELAAVPRAWPQLLVSVLRENKTTRHNKTKRQNKTKQNNTTQQNKTTKQNKAKQQDKTRQYLTKPH